MFKMALVLKNIYKGYFWLFDELADPRSNEYVLSFSPIIPIVIVGSYIYFVYGVGHRFMRNREPYRLKTVLAIYNLIQVILNLVLVYQSTQEASRMNFQCNPVDYSNSPEAKRTFRITYSFYLLKILDLADTVFMILKKNNRQITFLHVYHHWGMVLCSFVAVKFLAGGELMWTGIINLIVHSVMYTYYLLASLDGEWKKSLSFKKFLTQIQLVQFVANIVIYGRLFFINCSFPNIISLIYVPQNIFMLALFGDFYIKTYIVNKTKRNVTK